MTSKITYNKLVRDRIPEIIRGDGKTAMYSKLEKGEVRLGALRLKLLEESRELFRAKSVDEFVKEAADVLEVLQSLALEHGVSWQVVDDAMLSRREQRGGFNNGTFLHAVVDTDNANGISQSGPQVVPCLITPNSARSLLDVIQRELANSVSCRIATAFCSRSMLNLLINSFQSFTESGGKLHLLTSIMNNFNKPDDLDHIQAHVPKMELKVFYPGDEDVPARFRTAPPPFHLKCFLFEKRDGQHALIVGSSNLTYAGLVSNHEWNYYSNSEVNLCFGAVDSHTIFEEAQDAFAVYWERDAVPLNPEFLDFYRPLWEHARKAQAALDQELQVPSDHPPEPRQAQREALQELDRRRWLGVEKTAVIAATGLGKTHLAAFDFKQSHLDNILFVVHRENILREAQKTFSWVLSKNEFGIVLTGNTGSENRERAYRSRSNVFATVQTLSRPNVLKLFSHHHFDYIVFDEFHHSEASSCQRILDWFRPQFFLGLTATPERMDGRDVLRFCDYDVAYEARLFDAIDSRWLVPFQYYAIYDGTDYSQIRWTGMGYDEGQLEEQLSCDTRAELIACNLQKYLPAKGKVKALAFCSSKGHARYMSEQLCQRGFNSACLLGENSIEDRELAMRALQDEDDALQVICSVDIFSEGIDIPSVSHVLMLRPTQSFTVFLQQLGRGLRKVPGKEFLVVLDFIGNFRNSYVAPLVLRGFTTPEEYRRNGRPSEFQLPSECTVDADIEVQRVWDEDIKRVLTPKTIRERLADVYGELRKTLEHSPRIMDFFANPDACDPHQFVKTFGNWLRTKEAMDDLADNEKVLLGTPGEIFLQHIEKELSSNKSYKMVVLLVLLKTDPSRTEWTVAEIARGFKEHYLDHMEQMWDYVDMARSDDPVKFALGKVEAKLKAMPLYRLSNAEADHFLFDSNARTFALKRETHTFWKDAGFREMVSDRVLYALKRYFYRKKVDLSEYSFRPQDVLGTRRAAGGVAETRHDDDEPTASIELPFFPNLKIACGAFREGTVAEAETITVENLHGNLDLERHFVVRTQGDSMDGGNTPIRDEDFVLLEFIDPQHAGSLTSGVRAVAVEYRDDKNNLAYALKQISKDPQGRYQLVSWKPGLPAVPVKSEQMFPLARYVRTVKPIDRQSG